MSTVAPSFQPGDILTRADIRKELGGSPQGGICPSVEKKTVVLYSDIKSGEQYGYRDGWLREEDRLGPIFEYTGAGTEGNQTFTGATGTGNAAILQHALDGRTLHVFIGHGKVPGTGIRTHRYIGAFEADHERPYVIRQARDKFQQDRDVIVFRLRPLGAYERSESDVIPPATQTKVTFVQSGTRRRPAAPPRLREAWDRDRSAARATYQRDKIAAEYSDVLTNRQHRVGRLEVHVRGVEEAMEAALYDESERTIYEPADSNSRQALRDALMHLMNLRMHLSKIENGMPIRCMVLAPGIPSEDTQQLLNEYDVGIVYRNANGDFSELPSSGQNPPADGTPTAFPCVNCPTRSF
ncbi:hypothetical protein [Streptomyces sp. NPDC127108]|uniref:hypothetical protein n=1 Tax=Streptomyces sp. NPDC127108 TaxID=3345361 RepID=UPI00363C7892